MPVDDRMRAQARLILDNHGSAAAHPAPDRWDEVDNVEYLYREYAILALDQDANRVADALTPILDDAGYGDVPEGEAREIGREPVSGRVVRLTVPPTPTLVPDLVGRLDEMLGPGVAKPEHKVYVCPYMCPATEPVEVPGNADPVPPPGLDTDGGRRAPRAGYDGYGVSVSIVDTGLIPGAAASHTWLTGVRGTAEDPYITDSSGETVLAAYAGHGTFSAGVLRCVAPKASVFVERAFDNTGADYETRLASSLEDALNRDPDILVFTFTSATHRDQSLHTFDELYERRIRGIKGLVVLAPAGNDGWSRRMWRAAHPGVVAVGALAANWRERAHFSNYGRWVDVYAPGEDLINAFPNGTYVCQGAAQPRGTSALPRDGRVERDIVQYPRSRGADRGPGVADRGERPQAWDSLLRFACSQAIPGVGPVLYPGQACC